MVSVRENSYVLFSSFSIVNLVNNKLQKNKTDKIFFFFYTEENYYIQFV